MRVLPSPMHYVAVLFNSSSACSNLLLCQILRHPHKFVLPKSCRPICPYDISICFWFILTYFAEKFIQTSQKLNNVFCTTFAFVSGLFRRTLFLVYSNVFCWKVHPDISKTQSVLSLNFPFCCHSEYKLCPS